MSNNQTNISPEDAKMASSGILRKCCACGKISDRNDFIRILHDHKTGEYIINPDNKHFGRSMYLCKNKECLKLANKKKRLRVLSEEQLLNLEKSF